MPDSPSTIPEHCLIGGKGTRVKPRDGNMSLAFAVEACVKELGVNSNK